MTILDQRLEEAYRILNIPADKKELLGHFLGIVRAKDESTYCHEVRCALIGAKMAEKMLIDPKALFYAGLLHDTGKALIDPSVLKMTEGFGPKEYEQMKIHSLGGHHLLKGVFDFSADIIVKHHYFQERGYPEGCEMPEFRQNWSRSTQALIDYYARLLSIIDFYDSASTRENDKFGVKRLPTKEEVKELLLKVNKGIEHTINGLYDAGVLGNDEFFGNPIEISPEYTVPRLVRTQEDSLPLAEKVGRNIMLACALEPIPEKEGCTSRYNDLDDRRTLEMFVAGGINVGPSFMRMAEHVEAKKTPKGAYQFLKEAMIASKAKRAGGKINQGMLEFLTPLVIANIIYDPCCKGSPYDLFEKAVNVCRNTSKEDVLNLIEMKKIGNKISNVEHKYPVREHDVENVHDYYEKELELESVANHPTGIIHNAQFVEGFQDIGLTLDTFLKSSKKKFSDKVAEAYDRVMAKNINDYGHMGVGLAADFIAAMLYMALMYSKDQELIN